MEIPPCTTQRVWAEEERVLREHSTLSQDSTPGLPCEECAKPMAPESLPRSSGPSTLSFFLSFFLYLFYFFNSHWRTFFQLVLQREREGVGGKEGGRERGGRQTDRQTDIDWLPSHMCPATQTGDQTCNLGMCPDWELNP